MKSILLDTNVLLLFLVGSYHPNRIGTSRLKAFSAEHFDRIVTICQGYGRHISLPNILTEVSNFMGSGKQELVPNASAILRSYCLSVQETHDKSADIVSDPAFHRLGLTDTAILCLGNEQVTVLTVDFQLFNRLHEKKVKVINILNAP